MAFVTVTGRLLASHFQAGGEVPLSGQIFFTPTMEKVPTGEGIHFPAATSVELDAGGRFEVELLSAGFSWEVAFSLRHAGAFVPVDCFNFLPTPGVDHVNFSEIVPVTDPVTAQPMLRGEDGVGVDAITTAVGELIFTLTNGSETRIPVPQGIPGTGVEDITLEGDELVFTLSDGSETRLPAPKGTPGVAGVGISAITLVGGELVIMLTNGAESRLPAPKGEPGEDGKDGVSPPAPTLSVGNVATLPNGSTATASITGTSPDYALTLGIPQGAPGAKGDKGDDGDTPTITAGTVSTLPAGAAATADMVPTAGGYALNLGLPAGAPGANGKDAPTPTLAVGTVSTGTASASITGTAPNYTLNLTLPAGGGASVQDTGWREITSYFTFNQSGLGTSGRLYVRRIGQTVSFAIHDLRATASSFGAPLTSPLPGFHLTAPGFENRYAMGSVAFLYSRAGQPTSLRCSGLIGNNSTANFNMYTYLTDESFPLVLPGTPA